MAAEVMRLGMVRLTDAAPLVYAKAYGLFAAEGLDVRLEVEPSWANIADKLLWGLLDGAVMLPPLAIAMAIGLRGPATKLLIPAGVSLNGNAVTLATRLAEPLLREGRAAPAVMAARLRACLPLRLAVVHGFSTHDLLLRLFLESGGIDPARDVSLSVIPPAEMTDALAAGRVDGFCAGAPWGAVAAEAGVGRTIAVSSEIVPDHPEKCLAVRQAWAQTHPAELAAMLRALEAAALACDDPANGPEFAELLARPEWVGVPAPLIAASLPGGSGGEVDRSVFAARGARMASLARGAWFLQQMGRSRPIPAGADAVVASMYGAPLSAEAAGHR